MSAYKNVDISNYYSEQKHNNDKLARAYVPDQKFGKIYPPDKSLKAGTIFPELDMPYECKRRK